MSSSQKLITREALHEAIWTTPACHLAKAFGISPYALTKLCQQFDIPRPGNDYWPSIKLGYQVERTPLPPAPPGLPTTIEIAPPVPKEKTTEAKPVAKESTPKASPAEQPPIPPAPTKLTIAEDFRKAYPLVRHTRAKLEKAKPDHKGLVHSGWRDECLRITVSPPNVRRALLIMDALLNSMQSKGHRTVVNEERGPVVCIGKESVRIKITEKTKRKERALSAEEKQKSYVYDRYVYEPTGMITFLIDEYCGRARKEWRDGERQKVEGVLDEIAAAILETGEALRLSAIAHAEYEKQMAEESRLRWEIEQRRQKEQALHQALERQSERWHTSERLREFLHICRHALANRIDLCADSPAARWLDWAFLHADRIDPLRNGYLDEAVTALPEEFMRPVRSEGEAPALGSPPVSPA